ncbi:hypothetical protein CHS0354_024540 [Potamilus streckersoni]|uniref:Uncharacterized protein n=1 Tax=Potamilus streckersoni TaxID=2493646 RepID=A0AAE0WGD7_9BIVA|nr:hypothetical protein CHS0354_024540 [Potamilus streckersoni]
MAFTKGDKICEFTDTDGQKYCVDFSNYTEYEVSSKSKTVKVVRLDRMMGDLQPLPDNWKEKDKTILEVIALESSNTEYGDVAADFKRTLGSYQLTMIHGIIVLSMGKVFTSRQSENECNDGYTVRDTKGHKHMYRCKVLTGNSKNLTQGYSERSTHRFHNRNEF